MHLSQDQINKIISFLKSKMKLRLLILYGSYASGHATEKSDIDLAFLADDEIDSFKLCDMRNHHPVTMQIGTRYFFDLR